jgi:hypothetical protein
MMIKMQQVVVVILVQQALEVIQVLQVLVGVPLDAAGVGPDEACSNVHVVMALT